MKRATLLFALMLALSAPAWAVSKEILQLQQMIQDLTNRVEKLDNAQREKMAVMTQLVEKTSDATNRLQGALDAMQKTMQNAITSQGAIENQKIDGQQSHLQQISDSLDEMKARQQKLSDQITQLRQFMETIQSQPAPAAVQPTAPAPVAPAVPPPPSPQTLYENALRDMLASKTDLAMLGFEDYLKNYPAGERAENAQFYIGEIYYQNAQYSKSVAAYNKVIDGYPNGNKVPSAHLKKGYALAEMRMKVAAKKEFEVLIRKFPGSDEAKRARERIARL
jgi:tol-pal system protein YbgF